MKEEIEKQIETLRNEMYSEHMEKRLFGLLNTTLKHIKLITGESVTEDNARLIMEGILHSIPSKKVAGKYIDYCFENYTIQLNY